MTHPCSGRALRPHRPVRRRTSTRLVGTAAVATALVIATALPAFAHVTVSSPDASPGGFGKLVFRVPTESATASTTKLTVTIPEAHPFASVAAMPVPGWAVSTTMRQLKKPLKDDDGFNITKAVGSVTWTATGKGLAPGEFEEFALSVGPFPDKPGKLSIPALQTYSDGSVVKWDEPTPASGKEPEHPAPTLDITTAGATSGHSHAEEATTPVSKTTSGHTHDSDTLARWLGGGGLVLGLAALVLALTSRRRQPAS